MIVYVGCAIDNNASAHDDYSELIDIINQGIPSPRVLFNPARAFNPRDITRAECKYIYGINMTALGKADLAVFWLSGSFSVGVPVELHHCYLNGIPNIVLWTSTSEPGSYLKLFADKIVTTKEELARELASYPNSVPIEPPSLMG